MEEYRKKKQIGEFAENLWDEIKFKYGVEYGVLILFEYLFGKESDDPEADNLINEIKEGFHYANRKLNGDK